MLPEVDSAVSFLPAVFISDWKYTGGSGQLDRHQPRRGAGRCEVRLRWLSATQSRYGLSFWESGQEASAKPSDSMIF
jgi:hypothetical protein